MICSTLFLWSGCLGISHLSVWFQLFSVHEYFDIFSSRLSHDTAEAGFLVILSLDWVSGGHLQAQAHTRDTNLHMSDQIGRREATLGATERFPRARCPIRHPSSVIHAHPQLSIYSVPLHCAAAGYRRGKRKDRRQDEYLTFNSLFLSFSIVLLCSTVLSGNSQALTDRVGVWFPLGPVMLKICVMWLWCDTCQPSKWLLITLDLKASSK